MVRLMLRWSHQRGGGIRCHQCWSPETLLMCYTLKIRPRIKVIPPFFYNPSSRRRHNGLDAGGHASPDDRSSSKVGERPAKENSGTAGGRKISRSASARKRSYQRKEQDRLSKWSTTLSYPTSRERSQAGLPIVVYSGPNHQPNQHILQDRMHPKEPWSSRIHLLLVCGRTPGCDHKAWLISDQRARLPSVNYAANSTSRYATGQISVGAHGVEDV